MKINCLFVPDATFTVGELRILKCEGNFSDVLVQNLYFKEVPYALKILKTKSVSENQLELTVTSYQTGEHTPSLLELTDGVRVYSIDNISWNTNSILKEGSQMQPPYGPFGIQLPFWFVGSFFLIAICLLSLVLVRIQKKVEDFLIQKRVLKRIGNQSSVHFFIQKTLPLVVSQKSLESIESTVELLKKSLHEYLENKFGVSVFLSLKRRIRVVKNKKIKNSNKLIQILLEFDRVQNKKIDYSQKDLNQLVQMVRNWVFEEEKK